MTRPWEDVIARTRGLSSRLLGRAVLERVALSRDFAELVRGLEGTSYGDVGKVSPLRPIALEREMRRVAGDKLLLIATWAAERVEMLSPLYEDEDRRNLRAIIHGIVARTSPEQIVAGLLATPALSNVSLQALAGEARLQDVAATLTAWGNPYGAAMLGEATRANPDLFALQLAIDRAYAVRAVPVAERAGAPLLEYTRLLIDAENARAGLALALGGVERNGASLYIDGGQRLDAETFAKIAAAPPPEARSKLAHLFAGTVLAPVATCADDGRDGALLTAFLRDLRRTVRTNPVSLYVLIEYVLALRAELQDLARIVWGIALQVPRRRIASRLVTP